MRNIRDYCEHMQDKMDKRLRAELFRARLTQAMATRGLTQSALARAVGVDRSTVSQLQEPGSARLPNAQIAAEAAAALVVTSDWLLGLTDQPDRPGIATERRELKDSGQAFTLSAGLQFKITENVLLRTEYPAWLWNTVVVSVVSTLLSLVFVPAVFLVMDDVSRLFRWVFGRFLGKVDEPDALVAAGRHDTTGRCRHPRYRGPVPCAAGPRPVRGGLRVRRRLPLRQSVAVGSSWAGHLLGASRCRVAQARDG